MVGLGGHDGGTPGVVAFDGTPSEAGSSSAPPGCTSDHNRRQDGLTSHLDAALTPFPSCYYPRVHTRVRYSLSVR
jgi:hypothetical protein